MSSEPEVWACLVSSCQPDELHNLNGQLGTIIRIKIHAMFYKIKINLFIGLKLEYLLLLAWELQNA